MTPLPVYPGDKGWYDLTIVENFLNGKDYDIIIVDLPDCRGSL